MKAEKKTGLLERYFIACFRPSRYPELLKRGVFSHILFTVLTVLFLVVIESVIPFAAWNLSVGGYENLVLNRLPAFSVKNGEMQIDAPIEFDINGVLHIEANSDRKTFGKNDLDENYQEEILISNTNVIFKMGTNATEISLIDRKGGEINNKTLASAAPIFHVMVGFYFVVAFFVQMAEYLICAVFFAMLCQAAIRTKDGKYVPFKQTVLIALYARTLFGVITSICNCFDMGGSVIIIFLCAFGTMTFIDRAELAVLQKGVLKE